MNFLNFLIISYDSVRNGKCIGYSMTCLFNLRPIGGGNIVGMSDYVI